jgi:hypothetical protein
MRRTLRLCLLAGSGLVTLAFTSAALAAYSPSFSITRNLDLASGATTTTIKFVANATDDPTVKLQIFVPAGFTSTLNQAVGAQVGTVDGQIQLGPEFANAIVPVAGTITQGDRSSADLKAAAKQCTGQEDHAAIWLLNISAAGQTPPPVPVYVDLVTTPPTSAFASASVQVCLPHPSQVGFRILFLNVNSAAFAPPGSTGAFRWTALNTPYNANGTPNAAGTVETQAIDRSPVEASFSAKRVTKTRRVNHKRRIDVFYTYFARLTVSASSGGVDAGGVPVQILADGKKVAEGTTGDKGSFSTTLSLKKTTTYSAKIARDPSALVGATCDPRLPFPGMSTLIPCGTITEAGFTATTDEVTVKKPKLTVKHIKKPKKKRPKH